ncbi:Mss4-like protein [Mycena vitilis]|nr:Mss4-like protein [Mycena vitilis]
MSVDKVAEIRVAAGEDENCSSDAEATATCFCGAVQLKFAIQGPGFLSFICNCADCHKFSGTMFSVNFFVAETHLTHIRGRDNLTAYGQSRTIASGNLTTNNFCKTCGTLMYRFSDGYPGQYVLRLGTVDDLHLHETMLRPTLEYFPERRVGWLSATDGVKEVAGLEFSTT